MPEKEFRSLLGRERDVFVRALQAELDLAAVVVHVRGELDGERETERMSELLAERQRILDLAQRLVRVAQVPEPVGSEAATCDARIVPGVVMRQRMMLLGSIECDPLLQVIDRGRELAEPEERVPEHIVGDQEEPNLARLPGHRQKLLR